MKKALFILFIIHCSLLIVCAQPTQQWVQRFRWGISNDYTKGLSVKLDSDGNVYVLIAGVAASDSSYIDYGLLKYSPSGILLWSAYYDSPGLADVPVAFAVTPAGDVFITGNSEINFVYQILTVKFDTKGTLQWAKSYNNGPSNEAFDLALDNQGNISVIGGSLTGNGHTSWALTIKYDSNGDTLWTRRFSQLGIYSFTGKVITDDSCNVYTTGYYEPDSLHSCFLTLKYSPSGNLIWYSTYYYDPSWSDDEVTCITIDTNRNVYVAGKVYTPNAGNSDNALVKINPSGVTLWTSVYTGISGNNMCSITPTGVKTTPDGSDVYYTTSCAYSSGSDFITLNYNEYGDSVWVRRYKESADNGLQFNPAVLKLDRFFNIYITGAVNNPLTGYDYATIKYLPNGTQQWVVTYNGFSNYGDYASDLSIDTLLNVYVTGMSRDATNSIWVVATIKYSQPIGIKQISNNIPRRFSLYQNFPNPFNPTTIIKFDIPKDANVTFEIYDVLGRLVTTLADNEFKKAGSYQVDWDASNFSSGVYFYRIEAGTFAETKKMVLLK